MFIWWGSDDRRHKKRHSKEAIDVSFASSLSTSCQCQQQQQQQPSSDDGGRRWVTGDAGETDGVTRPLRVAAVCARRESNLHAELAATRHAASTTEESLKRWPPARSGRRRRRHGRRPGRYCIKGQAGGKVSARRPRLLASTVRDVFEQWRSLAAANRTRSAARSRRAPRDSAPSFVSQHRSRARTHSSASLACRNSIFKAIIPVRIPSGINWFCPAVPRMQQT